MLATATTLAGRRKRTQPERGNEAELPRKLVYSSGNNNFNEIIFELSLKYILLKYIDPLISQEQFLIKL